MFTIVGLGNPGDEYVHTRHNVGWIILRNIITKEGLPSLSRSSAYAGMISEGSFHGSAVGILFPTTFMNNSGGSVVKYHNGHGDLTNLIVVHDDIDIAFGEVRIGFDRGAGGHNGVKSIIDACGSKAFIRVRIGIAQKGFFGGMKRPDGDRLADYVLGNFKKSELEALGEIGETVSRALFLIMTKGVGEAMQEINSTD